MPLTDAQQTKLEEIAAGLHEVEGAAAAVAALLRKVNLVADDPHLDLTQQQIEELIGSYTAKRNALIAQAQTMPSLGG